LHSVLLILLLGRISAMSHITVFQPDEPTTPGPVALSSSFLKLKNAATLEDATALEDAATLEDADPSSGLLLQEFQQFIDGKGYRGLNRLRGSQAEEAVDFFDMVRSPVQRSSRAATNQPLCS